MKFLLSIVILNQFCSSQNLQETNTFFAKQNKKQFYFQTSFTVINVDGLSNKTTMIYTCLLRNIIQTFQRFKINIGFVNWNEILRNCKYYPVNYYSEKRKKIGEKQIILYIYTYIGINILSFKNISDYRR